MTIGRCRWTDDLLHTLTPLLPDLDRSVLVNALCEEWADGFNLHPLVRYEILSRAADRSRREKQFFWKLRPDEHVEVHTQLFKLVESTQSGQSLADDLEYLNHWSLSADRTLSPDNDRIHFVEQLHEIGYALSYRHRQHHKAVEVYRLALGFDDTNARSHHYLAFNLDWIAEDEDRVEHHYRKAIEYNPQHPWYHSRWISYLVTRGRNKESRQAFRAANDLIPISEGSPPYVFLGLHRWIARWMLHWGELAMAKDVLDSIPSEHRTDNGIPRLYDLLAALRMAEAGIAVFPLSVPKSRWWQPEGHTGLPIELNGKRLTWFPARVDEIADGFAYLSVGRPVSDSRFGLVTEQRELALTEIEEVALDFKVQELKEGRYLELAYDSELQLLKVGLHRSLELDDPELLPLVPPPNRWYQKARAAAFQQLASDQS
jgi:tetratricopeptide (TPR) repeat protein